MRPQGSRATPWPSNTGVRISCSVWRRRCSSTTCRGEWDKGRGWVGVGIDGRWWICYMSIWMYIYTHTYTHTYITLHCSALHYIYITLHYITLHLHYITLTLHYITLHYIPACLPTYLHTYIHTCMYVYIYIWIDISWNLHQNMGSGWYLEVC